MPREENPAVGADGQDQPYTLVIGVDDRTARDVTDLYALVGWGENYSIDAVRSALLNTGCVLRAVTDDGTTVGFARIFGDGRYYTCVGEIVVHPGWQRRGVGTALLTKASALYRDSPIFLETFRGQEHFFEASGFTAKEHMVVMSKKKAHS